MEKIIVIGGGISGLVSAILSKKDNNEVIILERNNMCGKKILSTGNGKCNYTNEDQDIKHYHSSNSLLIPQIINELNIEKMLLFLENIGIVPKIKNGYYYPYSNQAVTFQSTLIKEAVIRNINIETNIYVENINKLNNKFIIETSGAEYIADKVILATGSKAFPKSGSDGNGYELLKKLGHSIIKPLPSLVQLKVKNVYKEINGVRSDVLLKMYENGNYIKEEIGEIQFTDYGISGICTMQLSGKIARGLDQNKLEEVTINFVPTLCLTKEEMIKWFNIQSEKTKKTLSDILDSILNYKISNLIVKKNNIKENRCWYELTELEKNNIVKDIIEFKLEINDTNSFSNAQVCSGGIPLSEINLKTMESLKLKNLYIVGELLDVNGDCGGYNITFALITGMLAGGNIND